jgi:hypothetical protein
MKRWVLSQFQLEQEGGYFRPVVADYAVGCRWPNGPTVEDGWSLVEIDSSPVQLEAIQQDPRIVVCPLVFDPTPLSQQIIDAYADKGAALGMSMGALLAMLAETEPLYGA